MSIVININNIKNYHRYNEALALTEKEKISEVEKELLRLKKQRKYNFQRWRAKNLNKHREYMRQYHRNDRNGLKTRKEIREGLPKLEIPPKFEITPKFEIPPKFEITKGGLLEWD
jgi:hypothetical protein